MRITRLPKDAWIGLGVVAASVFLLIYIGQQPFGHGQSFIQNAGLFPKAAMYLVVIGGAGLFLSALRERGLRGQEKEADGSEQAEGSEEAQGVSVPHGLGIILVLALYVALLRWAGFLLLTPLALGAMMWLWGEKSWPRLVLISIVVPTVIYYAFKLGLRVLLPPGRILWWL